LDKSFFFGADIQILLGQLQNSFYPEIEILNFSSIGIREIPVQFYEWRLLSKNLKHSLITSSERSNSNDVIFSNEFQRCRSVISIAFNGPHSYAIEDCSGDRKSYTSAEVVVNKTESFFLHWDKRNTGTIL
jgi:hypothetical protein